MPDGSINNQDCKQQTPKKQQVQSKADEVLSGLAAKKKLLETKECVRCNLRKADLRRKANLSDAILSGADLSGAFLCSANLSDANLSDANLNRANLSDASLIKLYLIRANLSDANLMWANLRGANLMGANLSEVHLVGANLRSANLSGANLYEANLLKAGFCHTTMPDGSINNRDCDKTDRAPPKPKMVLSAEQVEPLQNSRIGTLYISLSNWLFNSRSDQANWNTIRQHHSDTVYHGQISNGLPNGKGAWALASGQQYIGEIRNGVPNGQEGQGTFTFHNGGKYVGEYKNNKMHGRGTWTSWNGIDIRSGFFQNGRFKGN